MDGDTPTSMSSSSECVSRMDECIGGGSGSNSNTEQFIICCKVCGALNNLRRCSRCKSVYYCSQVHQQVDWRVHKIECKKFATNFSSSEFDKSILVSIYLMKENGIFLYFAWNLVTHFRAPETRWSVAMIMKMGHYLLFSNVLCRLSVSLIVLFHLSTKLLMLSSADFESAETPEGKMVVETQTQSHHRINGKSSSSYDPAKQQKDAEYKRLTENTMKVCNVSVNLMENSLASRLVTDKDESRIAFSIKSVPFTL